MTKIIFQTTAIVLLLLPAIAVAQPRVVAVDPVEDVGVVSRGAKIKHTFEIRNEGDEVLTIREVQPACGCTVAEFDKTIAPGKIGRVTAVVDTQNFRGPIAKAVKVYTTDPDNAKLDLVIKANVRSQVEARPGYARMVVVQGESIEPSRQWLWASDKPDFEVLSVTSPFPHLKVSHRQATAEERKEEGAERQWLIDLRLVDDPPVGPMADHVVIRTNHPEQEEVRIPVSGFVRPVVSVRPRVGNFGRLELTGPFSATFDIQNLGSAAVTVLDAQTDVSGVVAEVEELEKGKRYRVEVTLDPGMAAGAFEGKLRIQTSSREMPIVEIDLSGTVL